MKTRLPRGVGVTAVIMTVIVVVGLAFLLSRRPPADSIQGEVEATHVNVSSKVPGRVSTILVREGQQVARGDEIAVLDSPEIRARLDQAAAAHSGAAGQRDKAFAGARKEEIRAAQSALQRAQHARELAEKTFQRVDRLTRDGVLPAQRRDEAEAAWKTSRDAEEAARAGYDMAVAGARGEDKATAEALVARAGGAIAEVEAALAETTLAAPLAGEIAHRNVEVGELVAPGFPIVTIVDLSDVWVTFNVREDRLPALVMGGVLTGRVPALGDHGVELKIDFIAAQGDFATWRATSAQGGFDLRTFEVRARPLAKVPGLRPGMSVIVPWRASR